MSGEPDTCAATAQHPELGLIGCELPAGHESAHRFTVGEGDVVEWDDEEAARPGFDIEAFVKALPEGVCLCPTCLGMGGVVEQPPFDPYTYTCPTCRGLGKTRTGSLRTDTNAERDCVDCEGRGFRYAGADVPPARPASAAAFAGDVAPVDVAGRTPDDPDFDWSRVVERKQAEPEPAPAPA